MLRRLSSSKRRAAREAAAAVGPPVDQRVSVSYVKRGAVNFLVDKAAGEVYRSLEDTTVIGTYSNAFGLRLDGETVEMAARLNSPGNSHGPSAMAPQFEDGNSLSFVNPLIELDTQIKPRTSIKVVDEPGGQAKSGYQGTNPDWLDSQHSALTPEPWFFDKGTMTPHGAVKKFAKGAQGQFLVRVVHGKELYAIPSSHHNGQPGNYAITMKINKKVYHVLILPSWDPSRQAEGETVYRVGTKSKKLFNSIPDLVSYYRAKTIYKDPETGKRFRLIYLSDATSGYQDIQGAATDALTFHQQNGKESAYADLPASSNMREQVRAATGTTGYMPVVATEGEGPPSGGDGYVDVAQSNAGGYIDVDEDDAPTQAVTQGEKAPYLEVSPPVTSPAVSGYVEVAATTSAKGYVDLAPTMPAKPLDPEFDGFDDDDDANDSQPTPPAPTDLENMDC